MKNNILDIAGLKVGSVTDLKLGSGVTVIVFDEPAIVSGSVLGGAPGGRETALLDPSMTVERADALVLSGGSAFGLDAAGGVQAGLREDGRGFQVGSVRVPIVPQAILFDLLNGGDKEWGRYSPYLQYGYDAYKNATSDDLPLGTFGAGTGATTATFKGGLGSASAITSEGHKVAALVAVNALGSPTVGQTKSFWAAPFERDGEFGFVPMPQSFSREYQTMRMKGVNLQSTTIGVVVTDAVLTKAQAHRLSIMAHDGLARAIVPAHLPGDGDTMFVAATGTSGVPSAHGLAELCHEASLVMSRAIARGVYHAKALPYENAQKAWRDTDTEF